MPAMQDAIATATTRIEKAIKISAVDSALSSLQIPLSSKRGLSSLNVKNSEDDDDTESFKQKKLLSSKNPESNWEKRHKTLAYYEYETTSESDFPFFMSRHEMDVQLKDV